jgi:hypothetical protein
MAGTGAIKMPVRSLQANSFAERFAGTLRRECLVQLLILVNGTSATSWPDTPGTMSASAWIVLLMRMKGKDGRNVIKAGHGYDVCSYSTAERP